MIMRETREQEDIVTEGEKVSLRERQKFIIEDEDDNDVFIIVDGIQGR